MDDYEDEEDRLIAQGGIGIPVDEHGNPAPLLPEIAKVHLGRKCLVLDLDETLLHSSFKVSRGESLRVGRFLPITSVPHHGDKRVSISCMGLRVSRSS